MKILKSYLPEKYIVKEKLTEYKRIRIKDSCEVSDYIRKVYKGNIGIVECFYILLLNRANTIIGFVMISQGGISSTITDIRLICKHAIESLCSGVILIHNHPSGNRHPSTSDIKITKKIKEALNIFDIKVLDHIIVTEDTHYSFADERTL